MERAGGQEEHEGERYLRLLGLDHLADVQVTAGGRDMEARDFLDICGEHARPLLVGFANMSSEDPRYEPTRNALRGMITKFVQPPQST